MYSPDYIKFKKKLTEAQKLLDQNILPSNAQHNELYNWMQGHFSRFKKKKLPPVKVNDVKHLLEQVIKLKEDISLGLVKGSSPVETKWEQKFELLKQFRQKNPRRWPLSTAADPEEKKLGIWCQDLRTRYRNEKLDGLYDAFKGTCNDDILERHLGCRYCHVYGSGCTAH